MEWIDLPLAQEGLSVLRKVCGILVRGWVGGTCGGLLGVSWGGIGFSEGDEGLGEGRGGGERDFSRGVYCCVHCTKVLKYDHYRVRQGS